MPENIHTVRGISNIGKGVDFKQ